MDGIKYRIKVQKDGSVMYYCEDRMFWNSKEIRHTRPKEFDQIIDAQNEFDEWQLRHLATAGDWRPQIESVFEK